jgi:hypothetical protein
MRYLLNSFVKRTELHRFLSNLCHFITKNNLPQLRNDLAYEKINKVDFCFFLILPVASEKPVWKFINQWMSHRHKIKRMPTGQIAVH